MKMHRQFNFGRSPNVSVSAADGRHIGDVVRRLSWFRHVYDVHAGPDDSASLASAPFAQVKSSFFTWQLRACPTPEEEGAAPLAVVDRHHYWSFARDIRDGMRFGKFALLFSDRSDLQLPIPRRVEDIDRDPVRESDVDAGELFSGDRARNRRHTGGRSSSVAVAETSAPASPPAGFSSPMSAAARSAGPGREAPVRAAGRPLGVEEKALLLAAAVTVEFDRFCQGGVRGHRKHEFKFEFRIVEA